VYDSYGRIIITCIICIICMRQLILYSAAWASGRLNGIGFQWIRVMWSWSAEQDGPLTICIDLRI